MSLQRLRWLTIAIAIGFLIMVQGIAMGFVMPTFGRPYGHAVSIGGFSVGIFVLATVLYNTIDRMQSRIMRQNEESEALYEIAVDIAALDDEREVLRSIVDRAREMLHADAASLCLVGPTGALVPVAHTGVPDAFRGSAPSANGASSDESLSDPTNSSLSADLTVGGKRTGELCVSRPAARIFAYDEVRFLRAMADLAAIEVQKSNLMERDRLAAVLEERERLAREMHDTLAQVLGYLHLKSEVAQAGLAAGDQEKVQKELAEISAVSHEAYADVREAILGLRENISQRRGFVEALREYTVKFSHQAGVPTQFEIRDGTKLELAPEAEVQLMRVIQEALTNVRKHSGAQKACVRLDHQEGLQITIEDDGNGFDPGALDNDLDRFGLFTMRERVERVGGQLRIDSVPGGGTRVCVIFSDAEAK